jgi:clan AA aspartic protease (TIGR02281 family)
VTDYRPSDDRVPMPKRPSRWGMPLLFVGILLLTGAVAAFLRPDLIPQVARFLAITKSQVTGQEVADSEFLSLYERYAIRPLGAELVSDSKVHVALAALNKEPCDKRAIFQATVALEQAGANRDTAALLKGFGAKCPNAEGEINRAAELYFLLGDYDASIEQANALARVRPDAPTVFYLRARAYQGAKRYEDALEDYATFFQLAGDLKPVVAEVFTRMSAAYEALMRHCEATMPLLLYISVDSERRTTPALLKTVSDLAKKGACGDTYAKGRATIPRSTSGVIIAKIAINGVVGNFVIDTGASLVTISRAFAARAKATVIKTGGVDLQTANGIVTASLGTADTIRLGELTASKVPLVVVEKSVGDGIDGLLGMSFLSRFEVVLSSKEIQIRAKAGG